MSEQEELQSLRQMASMLRAQIEQQQRIIADQQKALAEKNAEIENLNIQLDRFIQALRHAQKKIYGPSSEKMSPQMSLFEEQKEQIEFAKELSKDLESVTVNKKERKQNSQRIGIRAEMLDQLDLKVVEYTLPEDASCSICGGELKPIGKKVIRTNVEYEKPKLIITQTVQWVSKCTQCGRENSDNPTDHFEAAPVPKPLIPKSFMSASLMAEIMQQKFVQGVPFATGRRAWLFADTPEGAHANGIMYTLVLSAQRNQLDEYEYLKYLLRELPNIGDAYQSKPEQLDRYMPWSQELPQECRLSKKESSMEPEQPAKQF